MRAHLHASSVKVNRVAPVDPQRDALAAALRGNFSMNPNAVHKPEAKHDHQHKGAAVTDQWQRYTGDRQQRDRHSHVLEDVREDERRDPDNQKQSQLIAGKKSNEKTCHQEQREPADKKHSSNKSPLLADGGENVVVMHGSSGQKPELDLRVWRLESLCPTNHPSRSRSRD